MGGRCGHKMERVSENKFTKRGILTKEAEFGVFRSGMQVRGEDECQMEREGERAELGLDPRVWSAEWRRYERRECIKRALLSGSCCE